MTSSPCCWRGLRSGLSRGVGEWLRWVSCMPAHAERAGALVSASFFLVLAVCPGCVCTAGQHDGGQEAPLTGSFPSYLPAACTGCLFWGQAAQLPRTSSLKPAPLPAARA